MISQINPNLANELRYALDVMEENSHLGLDDHAASILRTILQRRIREAEVAVSSRPAEPVRFPAEPKKVLA
jgi:hypothetical protein